MVPLNRGGSVNPYSSEHQLSDALARGDLEQARAMVDDRYPREYPLHVACEAGDRAVVRLLLDTKPAWAEGRDFLGWSPLHAAACSGKAAVLEEMIERQVALDVTDPSKRWTPLHLAVKKGHAGVAIMLARAGASIRKEDHQGVTPLQQAFLQSRHDLVGALLRAEADAVRIRTGASPLVPVQCRVNGPFPANILRRDRERLTGLFTRAAVDMRRRQASFSACVTEYRIPAGLLAGTGASLSKPEQFEGMRTMIEVGDTAGLAFFHLIGCDARTRDADGNTLLHYAAQQRRPQPVDLLVTAGLGDLINAPNNKGQTPLDIVRAAGRVDAAMEKALLEHGACAGA